MKYSGLIAAISCQAGNRAGCLKKKNPAAAGFCLKQLRLTNDAVIGVRFIRVLTNDQRQLVQLEARVVLEYLGAWPLRCKANWPSPMTTVPSSLVMM
jgi:hypothetical protein